jgi:hypothetical protein
VVTQSESREPLGLLEFARRLRAAGHALGDPPAGSPSGDPGPRGFGADAPGVLGELGRRLHDQWAAALAERAAEARRESARLAELAERLGKVAADYADTDAASAARIARAGPGPDRRTP